MERVVAALCAGLLILSACGGDDSGSAGDEPAVETSEPTTTATGETTTVEVTTTAPATTAVPTTAAPTTPAPTAPTVTIAPGTVAQGTVAQTTSAPPPPTTAAATAPPTTTPLVSFAQFNVSAPASCPAPDVSVALDPPQVTISWKLAGVIPDDVYTAVDNVDGAYETGLPTQGSSTLNYPCDGNEHTYYVVAVVGTQKIVKSKKV